jgi:glycopeptide antibiotics resistance protein
MNHRIGLLIGAFFFTLIAIYGSLVPLQYRWLEIDEAIAKFRDIPMLTISLDRRADWVSNVLLFVPLGYFWLGFLALGRSVVVRIIAGLLLTTVLMLLSVSIEFSQLWFPPRTVSQNDIVAETIGGAVGCVLWLVFGRSMLAAIDQFLGNRSTNSRLRWMLVAYSIALTLYTVMPLDLTIRPDELHQKLKLGRIRLAPFQFGDASPVLIAWSLICDIVAMIPVGWCCTAWIGSENNQRWKLFATAFAFVAALEASQLLVYSRFVDTTDLLTGWTGIFIGIRTWKTIQPRSKAALAANSSTRHSFPIRWWMGVITILIAIMVIYWHPYEFTLDASTIKPRLTRFTTALFEPMYRGSELNALMVITRKSLTFGVLGITFAMAIRRGGIDVPVRRFVVGVAIGFCWAFALLVELAQILLPSHVAHWTDVLICGIGATLGFSLVSLLPGPDS